MYYSSRKRIRRIVAKANVMIAFFINLHIVNMRDDKNVIKITNSKKNICSTKNGSYHLNEFWVLVPVNMVNGSGKLEIYFEYGIEN